MFNLERQFRFYSGLIFCGFLFGFSSSLNFFGGVPFRIFSLYLVCKVRFGVEDQVLHCDCEYMHFCFERHDRMMSSRVTKRSRTNERIFICKHEVKLWKISICFPCHFNITELISWHTSKFIVIDSSEEVLALHCFKKTLQISYYFFNLINIWRNELVKEDILQLKFLTHLQRT